VHLLNEARTNVQMAPALEDSSRAVRSEVVALAPTLLRAVDQIEAIADLTRRLQRAAKANRVRVERVGPAVDSLHVGTLKRVSVTATLVGDTSGIVGTLAMLAKDPVALSTGNLQITVANPGAPSVAEELRTEITLHGWYPTRN
jgi:hypothetical protein